MLIKILQFYLDPDSEWNLRKTFAIRLKSDKISTICVIKQKSFSIKKQQSDWTYRWINEDM